MPWLWPNPKTGSPECCSCSCQGCVAHVWIFQDWFLPWGLLCCVQSRYGVAALGKCQVCLCSEVGVTASSIAATSPTRLVSKGRFISLFSAPLSLCLFNTLHVLLAYCICRAVITSLVAQTLCYIHMCCSLKEEKKMMCVGSLLLEKELKALHEHGARLVPFEWGM